MSRHDDSVSLRQMLDHVQEAISLSDGRARKDLDGDRIFFLALLKLVEIVGYISVSDMVYTPISP